jgi:hypothetical protein
MGCQSCWDYYYRQQKEQYILARLERGNNVRKKAMEPMLCPVCKQPCNSRNESEEIYNAKRNI